jgi:hypothetical protein
VTNKYRLKISHAERPFFQTDCSFYIDLTSMANDIGTQKLRREFSSSIRLVLVTLALLSCTRNDQAGQTFLLPWGGSQNGYSLQKVRVRTLSTPYEATGPAADIYLGNDVSSRGFIGDKARPRVSSSKGVQIPRDVESSMSLVIYAHMERLKSFDSDLGMAKNLSWPRQVGLQIEFVDSSGAVETNNAIYLHELDSVAFFPTKLNALPMAINGAVLAHEHFHAHFNAFELRQVQTGSEFEDFNESVILRGWNEGLADFYAYAYTGEDDFIALSIPGDETRKLSVRPTVIRPGSDLLKKFDDYMTQGHRRVSEDRRRARVLGCLSYPLGTQNAVFLYHMSQLGLPGDTLSEATSVLKFVMKRLKEFKPVLAASTGALDPRLLLKFIFEDTGALNTEQLDLFEQTVQVEDNLTERDDWKEASPCEK